MDRCGSSSLRRLLILLSVCVTTSLSQSNPKKPLETLIDRNRVLLVFAPGSSDLNFVKQQKFIKNQASEAADRDLIAIPVLAKWTSIDVDLRNNNLLFTTDTEQISLRSHYKIQPSEFTVVLLGKDGGEKLRSRTPVTMQKLNELIDTMPMRQQEVRHRKS
jgi:hypothetical protein